MITHLSTPEGQSDTQRLKEQNKKKKEESFECHDSLLKMPTCLKSSVLTPLGPPVAKDMEITINQHTYALSAIIIQQQ